MSDIDISEHNRKLAIILGSVCGALVIGLVAGIAGFCYRRRRARGSILTRAVTPLDDAEFESWRKPSKQIQWREKKYSIMPDPPAPVLTRFPSTSRRSRPNSLEKPLSSPTLIYTYRPKPSRTPEPGERLEHARNKSSLSSLQDRPPTPYSPTSSKEFGFPAPQSTSPMSPQRPSLARTSRAMSPRSTHVHYPSVSEASDFDFGFHMGAYNKI